MINPDLEKLKALAERATQILCDTDWGASVSPDGVLELIGEVRHFQNYSLAIENQSLRAENEKLKEDLVQQKALTERATGEVSYIEKACTTLSARLAEAREVIELYANDSFDWGYDHDANGMCDWGQRARSYLEKYPK